MKRPLLTLFLVALLSGCSAAIQYHPFVGDAQVLKGSGGACDNVEGVEIWVKGAPSKPFTVVGYIDGQYTEDIGEEAALKRLIVPLVVPDVAIRTLSATFSSPIRTSRMSTSFSATSSAICENFRKNAAQHMKGRSLARTAPVS